jgi:hypothetical protein
MLGPDRLPAPSWSLGRSRASDRTGGTLLIGAGLLAAVWKKT